MLLKSRSNLTTCTEPRSNWLHDCMMTSGAISKQEAIMATVEGVSNSEFSPALTTSLEDFIHKSLKDEQTECIRKDL